MQRRRIEERHRIWILQLLLSLLFLSGCVEEGSEEIAPEPAPAPVPSEEPEEVTPPGEAKWYLYDTKIL